MKYPILNRWTGKVQFIAEINCDENASRAVKIGLAARWGFKNGADLRGAVLTDAALRGAALRGADLTRAVLRGADLRGTDLRGAVLRGTDFTDADLTDADLRRFKSDLWMILTMSSPEVPNLVKALNEGRVDGSTYASDCACLVGTLNKFRSDDLPELPKASTSPAEQWFSMIRQGDKPGDNTGGGFASAKAMEWINEWQAHQVVS